MLWTLKHHSRGIYQLSEARQVLGRTTDCFGSRKSDIDTLRQLPSFLRKRASTGAGIVAHRRLCPDLEQG